MYNGMCWELSQLCTPKKFSHALLVESTSGNRSTLPVSSCMFPVYSPCLHVWKNSSSQVVGPSNVRKTDYIDQWDPQVTSALSVKLKSDDRPTLHVYSQCLHIWEIWSLVASFNEDDGLSDFRNTVNARVPPLISVEPIHKSTSKSTHHDASMSGTSLPSLQRLLVCPISKRL